MYLVSVLDDQPVVEASLGGRVDLVEMKTFAEELEEIMMDMGGQPFYLLLDYSRARTFDVTTAETLNWIKDKALDSGAAKVYSIPHDDTDMDVHVSSRIQNVLEGKEEFILEPHHANFAPLPAHRPALAA